jgi:hypothetical protein
MHLLDAIDNPARDAKVQGGGYFDRLGFRGMLNQLGGINDANCSVVGIFFTAIGTFFHAAV